MALAFPKNGSPQQSKPVSNQLAAIRPTAGQKKDILALVREILTDTRKIKALTSMGEMGTKLLRLPKGDLWQITLETNNSVYTCVLPVNLGLARDAKNKMTFAHLEARVAGSHACWLITDIRLV